MIDFDPTAKFKKSFFQECEELLAEIESDVSGVRTGSAESLDSLFRAVHTIKGGAGMFAFTRLTGFAHALESVLERLRDGSLIVSEPIIADVMRACDTLADLVQDAKGSLVLVTDDETDIVEVLKQHAGRQFNKTTGSGSGSDGPAGGRYVIRFKPHEGLFRRGFDPQLLFRELAELGTVTVQADMSSLPAFENLDPASCYIKWVIVIDTQESMERVQKVFEFVSDDSSLEIGPDRRGPERRQASLKSVETTNAVRSVSSIRVELDRIDKLVNQVGEIAIVQAMINQQCGRDIQLTHPDLEQSVSQLSQLIQGLQDSVMAIRAVPVATVFGRMPRLVRELAAQTGKQVELEITGEETEIDKTVIEQLGDPLLHMIRNAVDHGIEAPIERVAAGKSETGRVGLTARQVGGQLVIEVSDDGRGLDRERIKQKALDRGIVAEVAGMSDDEIVNLIFRPGFSTAEKITSISGRGVGMDVVKRNIQKLGGRISIKSEQGKGSRMSIALPLTLAILSGMTVRSGQNVYVVPVTNILECMMVKPGQIKVLPELGEMIQFRNRYVPLVRLGAVFNISSAETDADPVVIIANDENGHLIGIVVDEITGQQQVVIKNLRDSVEHVHGVSGATVLGDGTVALILILSDLLDLHRERLTGRRKFQFAASPLVQEKLSA
jgi:two-component system, chemotaxis family, sensor kinase CheA